jgi:hypothetical protein
MGNEAVYTFSPALEFWTCRDSHFVGSGSTPTKLHLNNSGEINEKTLVGLLVHRHAIERASQLRAKPKL